MTNKGFLFKKMLSFLSKLKEKTEPPEVRLYSRGILFCFPEGNEGLIFDVVNVTVKGFLIKPAGGEDSYAFALFKREVFERKKYEFKFTLFLKDDPEIVTLKARLRAVDDNNFFAFSVSKKDEKKLKEIYNKISLLYKMGIIKHKSSDEENYTTSRCNYKCNVDHTGLLFLLSSLEEKKYSIKEKKLRYGIYVLFVVFFLFLGLIATFIKTSMHEYTLNNLIKAYEDKYDAKILYLIHRKKAIGIFGFPVYEYLEVYDAHRLLKELKNVPQDKNLVIIVHSPGGELLAAIQIAKTLKQWKGKVYAVVPYYAMSAGTLISLASDEIIAGKTATFGPIDPQIPLPENEKYLVSAVTVLESYKQIPFEKLDMKNRILYITSKKAVTETEKFLRNVVLDNFPDEVKENIIRTLLYTSKTHDFPVFADDLKKLGLKVRYELPEELERIVNLLIDTHNVKM